MEKKQLVTDMTRSAGGSFVTRQWLADYMNLKDPKSVDRYLQGLPRLNKRYFVGDIADAMLSQCAYR